MTASFPRLRSDLEVISTHTPTGDEVFVVKDPTTEHVFELGPEEFFLCKQFDGYTDTETVRERVEKETGRRLSVDDVTAFARDLEREGFFEHSRPLAPVSPEPEKASRVPMSRIRFGNPDRLFGWLERRFRWCGSRLFLALALAFTVLGLSVLVVHGDAWVNSIGHFWSPAFPGILVLVLILGVMIPKEIVRGVACRYHGVHVSEFGVRLIYFLIPRFYIDLTQYRLLHPKAKQMWVTFAAGFSVIVLWSAGMTGWYATTKGSLPNLVFLALSLTAGVWGVLLVWNPLRRGEAYQLLSAWLQVPRLRERAFRTAKAWLFSDPLPEPLSAAERRGFRWYGVLAGLWLVGLVGALLFGLWSWLTAYYAGAGAVVFLAVIVFLIYRPIKTRAKTGSMVLAEPRPFEDSSSRGRPILRWVVRGVVVAGTVYALLLPYAYRVGGDIELRPVQQLAVTSEIDGIIQAVAVREGDWVEENQEVARLVQRDFFKDNEVAKASLREAEAELDLLLAGPKSEQVAKAEQAVREREVKLRYSDIRVRRLIDLHEKGLISSQDYDNALAERDVNREELATAKAQLELVKTGARPEEIRAQREEVARLQQLVAYTSERLARTILRAPISGQVVTAHVHERVGQRLEPGDELGTIADNRIMLAEILVLEDDVGLIGIGRSVQFKLWSYPQQAFFGQVVSIAPTAVSSTDPETRVVLDTVRVVIEVKNQDGQLKAGLTGYAKIEMGEMPIWRVLTRRLANWFTIEFWSWLPS